MCHALHAGTFTLSKGSPLLLRALNPHLAKRIILLTQHSVGNNALTFAQENFCIGFRIFSIRNRRVLKRFHYICSRNKLWITEGFRNWCGVVQIIQGFFFVYVRGKSIIEPFCHIVVSLSKY